MTWGPAPATGAELLTHLTQHGPSQWLFLGHTPFPPPWLGLRSCLLQYLTPQTRCKYIPAPTPVADSKFTHAGPQATVTWSWLHRERGQRMTLHRDIADKGFSKKIGWTEVMVQVSVRRAC